MFGGSNMTSLMLYVAVIGGLFYWLLIRPQKKYAKERETLISGLRVQDRIITGGGLRATITQIKIDSVMARIAENVEVEILKTGILSLDNSSSSDVEDDSEED